MQQHLDAVADPRPRFGFPRRGQTGRFERPAEAVVQIRRGIDERAVEIEREQLDGFQGAAPEGTVPVN